MCTETLTFSYIHKDRWHTICMFTHMYTYICPTYSQMQRCKKMQLPHGIKSVSRKEEGGKPDNSVWLSEWPIFWTLLVFGGSRGKRRKKRYLGRKCWTEGWWEVELWVETVSKLCRVLRSGQRTQGLGLWSAAAGPCQTPRERFGERLYKCAWYWKVWEGWVGMETLI